MSDSEIHRACSKFDINILEEASYVLWSVWKAIHPRYSTLESCISALNTDSRLYHALKRAHNQKKYDAVREWVHAPTSVIPSAHTGLTISDDSLIEAEVENFREQLRPSMKRLILGELELPLWSPDDAVVSDSAIKNHICSLRIPLVNGKPSVLLHDLGRFGPDPDLNARLENIFMPNHHTFLVNTSGSGKTRLLFEGLCKHWGFYFTSLVDSSQLGSSDIQNSIRAYLPNSQGFKTTLPAPASSHFDQSLHHNRRLAERVFSIAFLARLLIFNLFLESSSQVGYMLRTPDEQDLKRRWLLLQLQPSILRVSAWDIFDHLVTKLSAASDSYVNSNIKTLLSLARERCFSFAPRPPPSIPGASTSPLTPSPSENPIFLVLDEAQFAATQHLSSFLSSSGDSPRPVLREIVRAFEHRSSGHGVFIVVAGTGISKDVVDRAMASAIMKEAKYRWCSDTGAFDTEEAMRKYVERYLPREMLERREGRRLLQRMGYWLRGRHRFTAGYVAELLNNGFQRPHSLLDSYIHDFTQFRPTDAREYVQAEGPGQCTITSRYKLDFRKLKQNASMISTIYQITSHYMLRSTLPGELGQDEATFVEYGFARFTDPSTRSVAADEPLVLLAAANWTNLHYMTTYKYFAKQISHHETRSNGFENYVAYCLARAFSEGKHRIDEVFSWCGRSPAWAHSKATLVSLYQSGGVVEVGEVDALNGAGPSVTLGLNAKTTELSKEWLDHRLDSPICFPHASMGPDLLFVLKLEKGGGLIWVALQAKYSTGKNGMLSRSYLRHAMGSVTPGKFFIDKSGNAHSPTTDPDLVAHTLASLESLPRRRTDLGKYSVLRVVASFPAETGLKRCIEEDIDEDGHPIASLNMQFIKNMTKSISPVNFLFNLEQKANPTLGKRKKQQPGSSRKRIKI